MNNDNYLHICDERFDKYLKTIVTLLKDNVITEVKIPKAFLVDEKTGEVKKFEIEVTEGNFVNRDDFTLRFNEKAEKMINKTKLTSFSYQLRNKWDKTDFIRFDLDFKEVAKGYPPLHANADVSRWGKAHLLYPDDINLNLEKLNCNKAYYIFFYYANHPQEHPYDKEKNLWYEKKLRE